MTDVQEQQPLSKEQQDKIKAAVKALVLKDYRWWGSMLAQVAGFILLFLLVPQSPIRLPLILVYIFVSMFFVKQIKLKIYREHLATCLTKETNK